MTCRSVIKLQTANNIPITYLKIVGVSIILLAVHAAILLEY